jgi:hypothetical protein
VSAAADLASTAKLRVQWLLACGVTGSTVALGVFAVVVTVIVRRHAAAPVQAGATSACCLAASGRSGSAMYRRSRVLFGA